MDIVERIRKVASRLKSEEGYESMYAPPQHDPVAELRLQKAASASDKRLLKIAADIAGDSDILEVYESLGGKYKEAFGTPMFQAPSMPSMGQSTGAPTGAPTTQAPKPSMGTGGPKMPQATQPGGRLQPPQSDQNQQKIKVQLESGTPGEQGTSVSVG